MKLKLDISRKGSVVRIRILYQHPSIWNTNPKENLEIYSSDDGFYVVSAQELEILSNGLFIHGSDRPIPYQDREFASEISAERYVDKLKLALKKINEIKVKYGTY